MPDVVIVIEPSNHSFEGSSSGVGVELGAAMKQAILSSVESAQSQYSEGLTIAPNFSEEGCDRAVNVHILTLDKLEQRQASDEPIPKEAILYPLTLDLPDWLQVPAIYRMCRDVLALRQQVSDWGYAIGKGNMWLPIVLTAKGPLYAEAIGRKPNLTAEPSLASNFTQPVHLIDEQRQPLYRLGFRLLRSLQATPAVYLLQFGFQNEVLIFDRLFPFPATPAIASIHRQTPDLLVCHWRCLNNQKIFDLIIQ